MIISDLAGIPSSPNHTECRCKATGELLGYSPLHNEEDLRLMLDNARTAQLEWSRTPLDERTRRIRKTRGFIVENLDELAVIISRDTGKTRNDALVAELFPATAAVSYYCKNAGRFLREQKLSPGHLAAANKRSKIIRVPWGIVAIISPWNYPFAIPFSEVVMALLAGNAVVLKTASQTQMVGLALKQCFESIGLPDGLFSFINIPGSQAGDMLLGSGIDKLFFTGSVAVGQYLMGKAASTLTPVSLELGGNDPMLVCEDADLYRAVMGAVWGGFTSAGQTCAGIERIYVHERVYAPFLQLLKQKVESLQVDYYGTATPLNQLANISTPEPRLLLIQPWDKNVVKDIEKAILKSDLGLTPTNDGQQIRIAIPPLTEERRKDMVKLAKKIAEERKVVIRAVRRDGNDDIKGLEKKGELPEDESKHLLEEMQSLTDKYIKQVDELLERKEKEIMEI